MPSWLTSINLVDSCFRIGASLGKTLILFYIFLILSLPSPVNRRVTRDFSLLSRAETFLRGSTSFIEIVDLSSADLSKPDLSREPSIASSYAIRLLRYCSSPMRSESIRSRSVVTLSNWEISSFSDLSLLISVSFVEILSFSRFRRLL